MSTDDPPSVPLDELAAQAAGTHVAVIGGGIAGLVAAWECAKVGVDVTVFEASDRVGGTIRTIELDGLRVDAAADGFGARGLTRLIDELGFGDAVVTPATEQRWVYTDAAAPLPEDTFLGVPENMFSTEARHLLGTGGMWRAYLDRLRPPLTIGHERRLDVLVRTRMGSKVLDRLVAPLTAGIYGTTPDRIDVDAAAPGLNAALTRAGSLSGAVATLRAERGDGTAVHSLAGGMGRLVETLAERLIERGATVRTGAAVTALTAPRDGRPQWTVRVDDGAQAAPGEAPGADSAGKPGMASQAPAEFDAVIVATGETAARALLAPIVEALPAPEADADAAVETVTLVVDASGLDALPRGAEIVVAPGRRAAASAQHLTAKWEWLAAAARGRHVVRVTFGSGGEVPATAGLDDAQAIALARAEASALFGVDLDDAAVRAAGRERFVSAPNRAVRGRSGAATRVRNAVEALPRLAVTGAWLAGSGLAQIVPDAAAAADRLRRRALFGDPPGR
ncbi:protoporphyrinogen oxidase [Microbacterium sp.]|uniref:protoporphyrinogen oxidase n=1 Tax=Microbacterium sp. TaxID=51671 RepID=UPI003A9509D4